MAFVARSQEGEWRGNSGDSPSSLPPPPSRYPPLPRYGDDPANKDANGGGGVPSSTSAAANGRLSPPAAGFGLGLRGRDAVAILTCLFLLRLAFAPFDAAGGGPIDFSDSSVVATMELAFYAPFQSRPPGFGTKSRTAASAGQMNIDIDKNDDVSEKRTARPVPLDVDGDGAVEAMVVPVFLTRDEVAREREVESLESQKSKRPFFQRNMDAGADASSLEGWSKDGSWGLRVLNLKPLHDHASDDGEGGLAAGPFAPRSLFLSPLSPHASKSDDGDNRDLATAEKGGVDSPGTYPVKLLPVQVPVRRTRLGEEEKLRQRHRKENFPSGSYGKNSAIPPKDSPNHANYDRTRHYFCGRDWHHAAQSCHRHCGGGTSTECGEGETCYADTPCDAHIEPVSDTAATTRDNSNSDDLNTSMALTKIGTLPGVAAVWSDGSVSLHVITADIAPSAVAGSNGHRPKRARQKDKKPNLELRQLWRVSPFGNGAKMGGKSGAGVVAVDFEELGLAFEPGVIYGGVSAMGPGKDGEDGGEPRRFGDNGAILLGGRYTLLSNDKRRLMKVSFHALDAMTGISLWEMRGNHRSDAPDQTSEGNGGPSVPIIHTTSSARRRSHLPTADTLDPDLDNENAFVDGDDAMTSEDCMAHFRASVLDGESGALPHEFWDGNNYGSISVGRFDRGKSFSKRKRRLPAKNGGHMPGKNAGGSRGDSVRARSAAAMAGIGKGGRVVGGGRGGVGAQSRGAAGRGAAGSARKNWQYDLLNRAVPRRLLKQRLYNARHPRMGKPNVAVFHGREGLSVLSIKNGRPVCHVSLMDNSLYADMDQDGVIDIVQVVTSPKSFNQSSGLKALIQRIAKDASRWAQQPTGPVICHALVTSGLPPREEVFTAPLCLGGPASPTRSRHPSAAPPLLLEGSLGYGHDVVFAVNNGVVARYDFDGREVWRKRGGLRDGTPSWGLSARDSSSSATVFLGRVMFGPVREESRGSVSASSRRNQHSPGSPSRPILLSGDDGAALISPASGRVLSSVVYPQVAMSQPLLADMSGDGTDDLLVVSDGAIWGYRIVVETGRSGGFTIVAVTLLIGIALASLVRKSSHLPGLPPKRSTDV